MSPKIVSREADNQALIDYDADAPVAGRAARNNRLFEWSTYNSRLHLGESPPVLKHQTAPD